MTAPQRTPDKPLTPQHAWQPFTPRGIAAFGHSTLTRVVLVQILILIVVGLSLITAMRNAWVPVVDEAIQALPTTGSIKQGELNFPGESPQRLAENRHLGLVVDLAGTREAGHVADVEITFEKTRFICRGPTGSVGFLYDRDYTFSFNRVELQPWWGAWRWVLLALSAIAFCVMIFINWWLLAFAYMPVVKLITFFADRGITWRGAWRMSAAALLPGACLVALALVLYGARIVDLFHFGMLYALHVVMGWFFVVTSPFFLPKLMAQAPKNPFHDGESLPKNPFSDKAA